MGQNHKPTIIIGVQLDKKISKDIKDLNYTISPLLHIYRILNAASSSAHGNLTREDYLEGTSLNKF